MNIIRRIRRRIARTIIADAELSQRLDDVDRELDGLPTAAQLREQLRRDGLWHPSMGPKPKQPPLGPHTLFDPYQNVVRLRERPGQVQ